MKLFAAEFKQVVCSILYIVFLAAVAAFYFTQYYTDVAHTLKKDKMGEAGMLDSPQPGGENYGVIYVHNSERIVSTALNKLLGEYLENSYRTYPYGFIRTVRLSGEKQAEVAAAIERLTGQGIAEAINRYHQVQEEHTTLMDGYDFYIQTTADLIGVYPIVTEYDTFVAQMAAIDTLLGGGSSYAPKNLADSSLVSMTYEQALAQYNEFIEEDQITRGYARLFCDYMGISIALFSVFLPVGFMLRDSRAKAVQIVYSRSHSSIRLILSRYAACVAAMFLPILLLSTVSMVQIIPNCIAKGYEVAPFAYYFYAVAWLLPTTLICCSTAFFFTTLTHTPLGIAVQLLWSYLTLLSHDLSGDYAGALMIRHNTRYGRSLIMENIDLLIRNRVCYTLLALLLLICSAMLLELRRRGRLNEMPQFFMRFRRRTNAVSHNPTH